MHASMYAIMYAWMCSCADSARCAPTAMSDGRSKGKPEEGQGVGRTGRGRDLGADTGFPASCPIRNHPLRPTTAVTAFEPQVFEGSC